MTLGRIKSLSFPGLILGEIQRSNPGSGRLPDPVNVTRCLLRAAGSGTARPPGRAESVEPPGSPGVCASAKGLPVRGRFLVPCPRTRCGWAIDPLPAARGDLPGRQPHSYQARG